MENFIERKILLQRLYKTRKIKDLKKFYSQVEGEAEKKQQDLNFLNELLIKIVNKINDLKERQHRSLNNKQN